MLIPVPNVLYNDLETAKERLYEYNVTISYKETNKYLPNKVMSYNLKNENDLNLVVSKAPKDSFSLDKHIDYVRFNSFVTGEDSINKELLKKANANKTDLGILVSVDDNYLYLYGDTFSGYDMNIGYWNSNFMAVGSKDDNFDSNIKFKEVITDIYGEVSPICQGKHNRNQEDNLDISLGKEVTKIPTGGVQINDDVYIFLMSVRYWGEAGEWYVTTNTAYKANKNNLTKFKKVDTLVFTSEFSTRFGQIYPFRNEFDKEYIYFLAIPGGRNGYMSLLRVKENEFENFEKYELLVGKNKFLNIKEGIKKEPFYIINSKTVGEPSVMYNHYLNKWLISTLTSDGITFFYSDDLCNLFKDEMLVMNHEHVFTCYGGFIHDGFSKFNDQKIYMQVSQWTPIYNTSLYEIVFK